MKRALIAAGLCGLLLFLAACGGDDDDDAADDAADEPRPTAASQATEPPAGDDEEEEDEPAPSGGGINACELITAEEAGEALGGPAGQPEQGSIGEGFSQCLWRIEGGDELSSAIVIQARGDTSRDDFDRLVEENSPEVAGEVIEVEGLGDVAREQVATFVLEGDAMVVVTVTGEFDTAKQRELAQLAIGRLP